MEMTIQAAETNLASNRFVCEVEEFRETIARRIRDSKPDRLLAYPAPSSSGLSGARFSSALTRTGNSPSLRSRK